MKTEHNTTLHNNIAHVQEHNIKKENKRTKVANKHII